MVSKILAAIPIGNDAKLIEVETDTNRGLPSLQIVGMGNKAIDEAKERVRSAINNSGFDFPTQKITVNLAPAEIPKDGTFLDLPIALSILTVSKQLSVDEVDNSLFVGELALNGDLRPIRGIINIAEIARKQKIKTLYVPVGNFVQASLVPKIKIIPVNNLKSLIMHLKNISTIKIDTTELAKPSVAKKISPVLDDIYSQEQAKRALIIATAGRHNILFNGPPGTGKTMLAKTIISLLPPLTDQEVVEVTKLHNLSNDTGYNIVYQRPFRSPHHTASRISLIGGGSRPQPGEISLAHLGVLFLDEIPEFPHSVLESLRQPLEDGEITVDRLNYRTTYPANFMLVATMNPCPCGYYGDPKHTCSCSTNQILNYQKKISGPLLDRIDLVINVNRIPTDKLVVKRMNSVPEHDKAQEAINKAQDMQFQRYGKREFYNSSLSTSQIKSSITLSTKTQQFLISAAEKLDISPRSYFRIIKVARTIADIDGDSEINIKHIAESLQYRPTSLK